MSEVKSDATEKRKIVIKRLPVLITKDKIILNGENSKNAELLLKNMKIPSGIQPLYKEDVIYECQNPEFLKGESRNLSILNKLNILTNSSRTIAKYTSQADVVVEKTSDSVTRLIGQKNYDTVFTALCSVISQELKVRGILALLRHQKKISNVGCQTNLNDNTPTNDKPRVYVETSSQTDESCVEFFFKSKQRRRIKRQQLTPYVVKDNKPPQKAVRKIIINPNSIKDKKQIQNIVTKDSENTKNVVDVNENTQNKVESANPEGDEKKVEDNRDEKVAFPDLKHYIDEDSNISSGSWGTFSLSSLTSLDLTSDKTRAIFDEIDKRTDNTSVPFSLNPTTLIMLDGSRIRIPVKPEDPFHLITPDILKNVTHEERRKLIWHQAFLDWKYCLQCDEDGNLPIHIAVINNDLNLLRRQCLVLKSRQETVDITKGSNLTALQISILQNSWPQCTAMLLQHGADPLLADNEQRTCLHHAAEGEGHHLKAIIDYCRNNARQILFENEELWEPVFESKPDEDLVKILFLHMSTLCDNQGYTPLMLASKLGKHENVQLLVEIAPETINMPMPNCGNTALYLAVGAACLDAVERSNKSKVADHFVKTIEVLVENGADPAVDNHSGGNVNILLTEFNICELSMLIANKLTSVKYFNGEMPSGSKNFDSFMLIKDREGKVNIKEMEAREWRNSPVVTSNVAISESKGEESKQMLPVQSIVLPQNFKFENPKCFINATQMQPNSAMPIVTKIVDKPCNIILKNEKSRKRDGRSGVIKLSNRINETGKPVNEQVQGEVRTAPKRKPSGPLDLSLSPSSSKKMKTKRK